MGTRLWVGNLPFDATEPEVRALFAENGRTVVSVILKSDRVTGRPAGFGFIEMGSDEFAQLAVKELDGRMLRGRPMRVNEARPPGSGPGPRGPRPMGGPGGPGGPGGGGGGFRRPFGGPPPGAPGATPFGGKQTGPRGRKERRERDKERSEKPDQDKTRGGGKRNRFDGDDYDDD